MREYENVRTRRCIRAAATAVAALVVLGLGSNAYPAPQCPVVRYNPQCTGRTNAHATYDPAVQWRVATNSAAAPVMGADGTLYFATADKCFYAYSSNGSVSWMYRSSTSIGGSAAVGVDGSVYIAATGQMVALASGGLPLWSNPFRFSGTAVPTSVLIDKSGTLYFGTDEYQVYAVNPDGSAKWSATIAGKVRNGLATSPDGATIYVSAADGRIYALDASSGALKWKTAAISAVYNCAVADDGTVYVGSTSGKLYAFASDGTQKWAYQTQSKITCAPAIASDGTIYVGSQDLNLYAIDPNGLQKWHYRTGGPIYSAPTLDGAGSLIFGAWPGTLTAIDASNGSLEWTRALGSGMYNPVLIAQDGSIYTLCTDGSITRFSGPQHPEPSSIVALGSLMAGLGGVSLRRRSKRR